jgi:hypothetical protein
MKQEELTTALSEQIDDTIGFSYLYSTCSNGLLQTIRSLVDQIKYIEALEAQHRELVVKHSSHNEPF